MNRDKIAILGALAAALAGWQGTVEAGSAMLAIGIGIGYALRPPTDTALEALLTWRTDDEDDDTEEAPL